MRARSPAGANQQWFCANLAGEGDHTGAAKKYWISLEQDVNAAPNPAVTGALNPDQAISVEQAITAFTSAPAESMGLGDVTGRLKVGYSADFIVLDRDLFTIDARARLWAWPLGKPTRQGRRTSQRVRGATRLI